MVLVYRGSSSTPGDVSSSAQNAWWFDGCALDPVWFDCSFHAELCFPRLWNARRSRCWLRAGLYLRATSWVTATRQRWNIDDRALMGRGHFSECCQVRRLFEPPPPHCPVSLCYPAVVGRAGVGLICTLAPVLFQPSHSHSRMIEYSAGMGAGSPEPAGCSLEDFNFVFLSLPFSSVSPTVFVHSCVRQCDYNRERSTFARTYVTDWLTDSAAAAASIKNKMR